MTNFFEAHPVYGFIMTLSAAIMSFIIPEFNQVHHVLKAIGQDLMIVVAILTGIGTMFKLDYRAMVVSVYTSIRNRLHR